MKKYPFSKQFLTMAAAATIALPSTAVFADQGDITYELVPVAATTSALPSLGTSVEVAEEGLLSGSISEVMPTTFATTVTTANPIEFEIKGIGTKENKTPALSGVKVGVYDAATDELVAKGSTGTDGKFKTDSLLTKSYYAIITDGTIEDDGKITGANISMTTPVFVGKPFKSGKTDTQKISFLQPGDGAIGEKSVGAIKGYITGGKEVRIYNGKNTWTVPVSGAGTFNAYLPAGKYNVVVMGTTPGGFERNILYKNVTVAKGQASAPLEDMVANVTFGDDNDKKAKLGLGGTINFSSKETAVKIAAAGITDAIIASADSLTFTLMEKTTDDTIVLGTQVVKKAGKDVTFKLKAVPAGKKLQIKAVDGAYNTYVANLNDGNPVSNLTPSEAVANLTADTTKNTVESAIDVTFKDTYKIVTDNIKKVTVTDPDGNTYDLARSTNAKKVDATGKLVQADTTKAADGDFMVSSGKITFGAGKIGKKAGKYTLKISGVGFDDLTVEQTLTAGAVSVAKSTASYVTGDGIVITAKDQYDNPIKDAYLYMDITTTMTSTSDVIKIDTVDYKGSKATANKKTANKTGEDGKVTVPVDLTNFKDSSSKAEVQVKTEAKAASETNKVGNKIEFIGQ